MEKSKVLSALNKKKELSFLKKQGATFFRAWLKAFFIYKKEEKNILLAWSLPKAYISSSVLRNRFKRWGRESLRKSAFRGKIFILFLKKDKDFYKNMKRKEFDIVFKKFLEKIEPSL